MNKMIFNLQRFGVIDNYNSNTLVSGTNGNDSIWNTGSNVTINAGTGNDTIYNYWASSVTINTGEGNDSVYNCYDSESDSVTINTGAGDDSVYNGGNSVTIETGVGDDSISNDGDSVTIDGGAGDDTISNEGDSVTIDGGAGNDSVDNWGLNVTINSGSGKDTIYNRGENVTIDSGAGNDSIYTSGYNITITGGAGNDSITSNGTNILFKYTEGDGNDRIEGISATDTLEISSGSGTYSTQASGEDIIVTVGDGKITLVGAASKSIYIEGKKSAVTIPANSTLLTVTDSTSSPVTVGSSVKVINAAKRTKAVKITGNALANSITGGSGKDSLYGGSGNDTILGNAGNDKLYGQAGNDYLSGGAGNDSLAGGAGNDTFTGGDGNDVFVYGGGNDVITDYAAGDKIKISSGTISKATVSGSDVIFTIGKNTLTVKKGKGKTLDMINSAGKSFSTIIGASSSTTKTVTDSTSSPVTVGSAIKTIDASTRTKAVKITGNALANTIKGGSGKDTILGGAGNDSILGNAGNDKLYGQDGNDYLNGGAGDDTLSGGAGNDTLTGGNGNDLFIYSGGNDIITDYAEGDRVSILGTAKATVSGDNVVFTVGSNKITLTGGADKEITYIDKSGSHTYSNSGSDDVSISGKTIKLLESYLEDTFDVADYGTAIQNIDASDVLLDMSITGNVLRNSIKGGENNETLTGGKGNDTLTGGYGADVFLYASGDGNDIITDYAEEDKIQITSGKVTKAKKSGNNILLAVGNGTISVVGAANKVVTYSDSEGEHTFPQTVRFSSSGTAATILSSYTKDSFDINDYDDYSDKVKTINSSLVTHDIEITGNKLANSIIGSENNETLTGGKGNDTLTGGDGSDVFVYNSGDGNDVITDYAEEDKIQIASGTAKVKKSGKDVIFTVGSGKITVTGAATKTVTYIDASGETNYYPTTPASSVIFTDSDTKAILRATFSDTTFTAADYNSSIKTIDASSVTQDIRINGNGKANVILGGYENDTINGSKGNDTLQGGSGADVFLYADGDGNDIITDYAEEDTIKITKGTAKVAKSGSNVVFTIGSGKITLAGAADKTVTYIDANNKTKTYGGSASNVLEDDNFITGNDLSSIVESKAVDYAFAKIETQLTVAKTLQILTYSSKK